MPSSDFIRHLPKAELHVHIEGTLEPELLFSLAKKNGLPLAYPSVEALRAAYQFDDLQSFLDLYYQGAKVLQTADDFYELARAYLLRAKEDGVVHAEIFFDPQTHTERGVSMATVFGGLARALREANRSPNFSSALILCFLRHLPEEAALACLEEALLLRKDYEEVWIGVGLDSSEVGHPPAKFVRVFEKARKLGFRVVAHAGEEGPPAYIHEARDLLNVERIDHGVRAIEDAALMTALQKDQMPLTVCPLSNVKLRVVKTLGDHNLKKLLAAGVCVTINSDDPAYFGGYLHQNFVQTAEALSLSKEDIITLAKNSVTASFLPEAKKAYWHQEIDRI